MDRRMMKTFVRSIAAVSALLLSACTTVGVVDNQRVGPEFDRHHAYTMNNHRRLRPNGENSIFLAFSGGGTRAAALAYGMLKELRDTKLPANADAQTLLDDVDRISSVSGGSFTSAYYGLFGDRIFEDFEEKFLRKDVQSDLALKVINPLRLFSSTSRTELAVDYYDRYIFEGKTFADMDPKRPMILINATDLMAEAQFIFFQPQFDFLCSDISSFNVARAVAASSSVPLLFEPILVQNYRNCGFQAPDWLNNARVRAKRDDNRRLGEVVRSFDKYLEPDGPDYAALVDGGITDNIGLRTLTRSVSVIPDRKAYFERVNKYDRPKRFIVIAINASTAADTGIGRSLTMPSISATVGALTDVQLHLYNTETNAVVKEGLQRWAQEVSTPEQPVIPYFIELDAAGIEDPEIRKAFNATPTSFRLTEEQVDLMIELGGSLLRNHPTYQALLQDLGAQRIEGI